MKKIIAIVFILSFHFMNAQDIKKPLKTQIVEVSCGQCQFGMKGKKGCDLAARIDGKSYFVDGTTLDNHGDAHAKDGLCSTIRKAEVVGEIKNGHFVATSFKLIPLEDHDDHKGHNH